MWSSPSWWTNISYLYFYECIRVSTLCSWPSIKVTTSNKSNYWMSSENGCKPDHVSGPNWILSTCMDSHLSALIFFFHPGPQSLRHFRFLVHFFSWFINYKLNYDVSLINTGQYRQHRYMVWSVTFIGSELIYRRSKTSVRSGLGKKRGRKGAD